MIRGCGKGFDGCEKGIETGKPENVRGFAEALSELSLACPALSEGLVGAECLTTLASGVGGNLNDVIVLCPSSSSLAISTLDPCRIRFSRPCRTLGEGETGGSGRGRGCGCAGGANASCGTPGGGRKVNMPPGLNSCAAALSGRPNEDTRVCDSDAVAELASVGGVDVGPGSHDPDERLAPKTNGFASGLSESLRVGAGCGIGG